MPAHSSVFPWSPYYGHFQFFEDRIRSHGSVIDLTSLSNGLYDVKRKKGKNLRVFICECYSFGFAEYIETSQKLGHLDVIIINSAWCGYTIDTKYHCYSMKVVLYNISEFMKSLKMDAFWSYLDDRQTETFVERGWM